jgi:hypothetical protein
VLAADALDDDFFGKVRTTAKTIAAITTFRMLKRLFHLPAATTTPIAINAIKSN